MSQYHITNEKYINPYNFVSIDENVERGAVEYGALSGVISCEMETLSPLFIPNTTKDDVFSDTYSHSYDFFSYEDLNNVQDCLNHYARPIIPGSSIRGMVRSAYEAATNSCMSTCDDESTLYRRTPIPRKFFGILEKNPDPSAHERILYKATKLTWPVSERGEHKTGEELLGGIYLRGENFSKKKNDAIMKYDLDYKKNKIEIARFAEDPEDERGNREWSNLVEVWRLYQHRDGEIKGVNQNDKEDKPDVYNSGYPGYLNAEKIPVYYMRLDKGGFYYLAPAAITKEVFSRNLKELLEAQGGHNPCEDGKNLCAACRLFGMAGEESVASRLMFRDGKPDAPEDITDWSGWYGSKRVLPILSGPKVSATEFYMEDIDGAAYFNYDYTVHYYDEGGSLTPVRTFLENPKLRGRKFYWHRKNIAFNVPDEVPKQHSEIRPVAERKPFKFDIYFDRLTPIELETLLWVLTFGEYNNTNAHKLGHAKPYGYGGIRVTKADVSLITIDDNLSLTTAPTTMYTAKKPPETEALREYLKLTGYSNATDDVKYMLGDRGKGKGPTIYDWFGINKEIAAKAFAPAFNYVLPKPLDDPRLPGYAKGDGKIGGNRAKLKPAAAPERQVEETRGATIGDVIKQRETALTADTIKKTTYNRDRLKRAGTDYARNPQSRKLLDGFFADYEADPEYYKDLKGMYDSLKGKYKK